MIDKRVPGHPAITQTDAYDLFKVIEVLHRGGVATSPSRAQEKLIFRNKGVVNAAYRKIINTVF